MPILEKGTEIRLRHCFDRSLIFLKTNKQFSVKMVFWLTLADKKDLK